MRQKRVDLLPTDVLVVAWDSEAFLSQRLLTPLPRADTGTRASFISMSAQGTRVDFLHLKSADVPEDHGFLSLVHHLAATAGVGILGWLCRGRPDDD